jgi:hypothetical protein
MRSREMVGFLAENDMFVSDSAGTGQNRVHA